MLGQLWDAGNTTTLARYLDLLGSAGLIAGLQKYAGSAVTRRASSPKLNVLNTALMTADSGYSFAEAQADRTYWGRIVESAVGAHLYNTATSPTSIRYWRDRTREVDFVLQRGPKIVAIEVKGGRPRRSDSRALEAFAARFREATALLVGENGIPLNEFSHGSRRYLVRRNMSHVERTCTEVPPARDDQRSQTTSRPLKAYRDAPAYVLLGDAGAGKTTAFETECNALGDEAILLTARDFNPTTRTTIRNGVTRRSS